MSEARSRLTRASSSACVFSFFSLEVFSQNTKKKTKSLSGATPSFFTLALFRFPLSFFLTTCSSSVFSASKEERGFSSCCFLCGEDEGDGERSATEAAAEPSFLRLAPPPTTVLLLSPPSSSASSGAASSRAWRMRRRGSSTGRGAMLLDRCRCWWRPPRKKFFSWG